MLFSGSIGVVIGCVNGMPDMDLAKEYAVSGLLTGITTSGSISWMESFLFSRWLKRLQFVLAVLIRTFYYAAMVTLWLMLSNGFTAWFQTGTFSVGIDRTFYLLGGISLAVSFGFNWYFMINRLLGRKVLGYFMTGKYHTPVEEERIFMFLDLKGSTEIAEELGNLRYQSFVNDFLFDITDGIVRAQGEIYKYVGDAVIVSWPMKVGLRQGNCIRCYGYIRSAMKKFASRYQKQYGVVPDFRIGMHGGLVVTGEVGDNKREIAFLGDVVNVAARIQEECKNQQADCLISGDLLRLIEDQVEMERFHWEKIGDVRLRGKVNETELIRVWV